MGLNARDKPQIALHNLDELVAEVFVFTEVSIYFMKRTQGANCL